MCGIESRGECISVCCKDYSYVKSPEACKYKSEWGKEKQGKGNQERRSKTHPDIRDQKEVLLSYWTRSKRSTPLLLNTIQTKSSSPTEHDPNEVLLSYWTRSKRSPPLLREIVPVHAKPTGFTAVRWSQGSTPRKYAAHDTYSSIFPVHKLRQTELTKVDSRSKWRLWPLRPV